MCSLKAKAFKMLNRGQKTRLKNVKIKLDYEFSSFVEVGFAWLNYKKFAKYSQASIFIPVA